MMTVMFPEVRMRRLRRTPTMRRLVRETIISVDDLVLPLFVDDRIDAPRDIEAMPGVRAYPLSMMADVARDAESAGLPAVLLFGVPMEKDGRGSQAYATEGVAQRAVADVKDATELVVMTDLCLCEYTSHGHCGLVDGGEVLNDETLELYADIAVSQADAGADVIAPSGMMDGMVGAIRGALDANGYHGVAIMSYAAKYASAFYGPFRECVLSTPSFGDRRSYQMDPANAREALKEMELDLREGADMLMVKPALPYLDIIRDARQAFDVPVAAYSVSGEYSMIAAAAANGWIDLHQAMMESLLSIKRAGADIIITYYAKDAAVELGAMR